MSFNIIELLLLGFGFFCFGRLIGEKTEIERPCNLVSVGTEPLSREKCTPPKIKKHNPGGFRYDYPDCETLKFFDGLEKNDELNLFEFKQHDANSAPFCTHLGEDLGDFESILIKYDVNDRGVSTTIIEIKYFNIDEKLKIETLTPITTY